MKVTLGPFACSCLRDQVDPSLSRAAEVAMSRYADRIDANDELPAPPAFFARAAAPVGGAELELAVEPEIEAALIGEALRCDVPLELIVDQAVFACVREFEESDPAIAAEERLGRLRYGDDAFSKDSRECQGRPIHAGRALAGGNHDCDAGSRGRLGDG